MTTRYVKTETGRQAIRDRAQALSRPARNLLLIIDGGKPGTEWVALVNGSTPADLQLLIDGGMVDAVPGTAPVVATIPVTVTEAATTTEAGADAEAVAEGDEPVEVVAAAPGASAEPAASLLPDETAPLSERLRAVGYRHLYDTMTAQARPQLGLIKGYRKVLEVEKCNGPDELRVLAMRFIDDVRRAQGPGAAYRVTEALCTPA